MGTKGRTYVPDEQTECGTEHSIQTNPSSPVHITDLQVLCVKPDRLIRVEAIHEL